MLIPESLMFLAGFALAHSAWSICEAPEGESLTPLAIVEQADERRLLRFEADTQAEAIANGKAYIAEHGSTYDAWVFVSEGLVTEDGAKVDVLTVEARAAGMDRSIIFIQRFQPYYKGRFKLLRAPTVFFGDSIVDEVTVEPLMEALLRGILSHGHVAPLWNQWISP